VIVTLAQSVYHFFVAAGVYASYAVIVLFIIAAVIKSSRPLCGLLIHIATYIWGIGIWLSCAISLYLLWHWTGLIVGVLLFGIGVVPLALVAMLLNGYFAEA
jgi:hypothetical protein